MPALINDRTGDLRAALKERNGYTVSTEVTITVDEKESQMSEFFIEVEEIMQCLERIESTVEEVGKKYNAVLSTPQTDTKLSEEIESLTNDIKRLANKVRSKLKIMEQDIDAEEKENETSATYRMKHTQHLVLSKRFVDVMFLLNKIQDNHREKCKERIKLQFKITGEVKTDEEIEEMLESGNLTVFIDLAETQRAKDALADVEARHSDILKLEKSIRELHEMFIDVSVLVENQGEMINNIENYVQRGAEYAEKARIQLKAAREHQKSLRKKKIIIAIIVIVVVAVVGVIIWVSAK